MRSNGVFCPSELNNLFGLSFWQVYLIIWGLAKSYYKIWLINMWGSEKAFIFLYSCILKLCLSHFSVLYPQHAQIPKLTNKFSMFLLTCLIIYRNLLKCHFFLIDFLLQPVYFYWNGIASFTVFNLFYLIFKNFIDV